MSEPYEITGGAGPFEVAAVTAAVIAFFEEEAAAAALPVRPFSPGAWVMAGRPRPILGARSDVMPPPRLDGEGEEPSPEEG